MKQIVLSVALLAACGGGGSNDGGGEPVDTFHISGSINITEFDTAGDTVIIAWDSKSGDRYYFGHGAVRDGRYEIDLERAPPADAIQSDGVGVGYLMLVEPTVRLPAEGGVIANVYGSYGASGRPDGQSVIWRGFGSRDQQAWVDSFEDGYGCGRCAGQTGPDDSFEPGSCRIDIEKEGYDCEYAASE